METTLVLIKPGGVKRRLVGEIARRIEQRGLDIVGLRLFKPQRKLVEKHYAEHVGKAFYEDVVSYLSSDLVVVMAVRGVNAVRAVRTMMGATDPVEADPGTVRGDLALSIDDNLTHSSADAASAARELALWFPEGLS
jgi:nucleoside-diphosphate kinase